MKKTMTRRALIKGGLLAGAGMFAAPMINTGAFQLFAQSGTKYSNRAIKLVRENQVLDMLSLLDFGKLFKESNAETGPLDFTHDELGEIQKAGINVFHPAVGIGGPNVHANALAFFSNYNGLVAEHSDILMRIDSMADLDENKNNNKIGLILGLQNSSHFRNVKDVNLFYHMGQRISQLTYNSQNMIGSGSTDRADGGISSFGETIVKQMNKVGMAIDVSHCGDQTTRDAFELSTVPVLITHSNARALTPGHPRCKPDDIIKLMGNAGSVMGITAVRNFVKASEPTTLDDYINHIDHVVKLTGMEHVGIGSDADLNGYDDIPEPYYSALKAGYKDTYAFREKIDIEGMDNPKKMFDLAEALIRRGYSDDNIGAIFGGNFHRVLGDIWKS
jgi:membrane dipeptidase